ncbi:DUF3630 family protein [Pseudoalteromonas sp. SSDWG2]|uniref:DUF3630 family protein n=1 Tax=Pseudoalteromonas sp. SSDWG2 TaxID=3139391 RepID=UPI003BA95527
MTTLSLDRDHFIIIITPDVMPDADEFDFWSSIFLAKNDITLGDFEQGADRHMQRFYFQQQPFELHYEYYGDNIWIAPSGVESQQLLEKLSRYLRER